MDKVKIDEAMEEIPELGGSYKNPKYVLFNEWFYVCDGIQYGPFKSKASAKVSADYLTRDK